MAAYVSTVEFGLTFGSCRYPEDFLSPTIPSPYWPRTVSVRASSGVNKWMDRSNLTFSFRIASPSNDVGGSIAIKASSINMQKSFDDLFSNRSKENASSDSARLTFQVPVSMRMSYIFGAVNDL